VQELPTGEASAALLESTIDEYDEENDDTAADQAEATPELNGLKT
jgi:hypothetical protein